MQTLQALGRVEDLEELLLLGRGHHQVGGEGIGEAVRVAHLEGRHQAFEGQVMRHLGVLLEGPEDLVEVGLELLVERIVDLVGVDRREQGTVLLGHLAELAAALALDHHLDVAVGQLQVLDHPGHHTDALDVPAGRIVDLRIFLGDQEKPLVARRQSDLESLHRAFPSDNKRRHHVWEDHHVAQRNDRQFQRRRFYVSRIHRSFSRYPARSRDPRRDQPACLNTIIG